MMKNSLLLFGLLFVSTNLEYAFIRYLGGHRQQLLNGKLILGSLLFCLIGAALANVAINSGINRQIQTPLGVAERESARNKISLPKLYGYIALLIFVINLGPIFSKSDYSQNSTMWDAVNPLLLSTSGLLGVGVALALKAFYNKR